MICHFHTAPETPVLTHWGIARYISRSEKGHHAWATSSHYLNQYWLFVEWPFGTNFSKIWIQIQNVSLNKRKMPSEKTTGFCSGLYVLSMRIITEWYPANTVTITSKRCFALIVTFLLCTVFAGYRKVSNIRRTKSQNLNASRLIL